MLPANEECEADATLDCIHARLEPKWLWRTIDGMVLVVAMLTMTMMIAMLTTPTSDKMTNDNNHILP